jgi:hypothetical protein
MRSPVSTEVISFSEKCVCRSLHKKSIQRNIQKILQETERNFIRFFMMFSANILTFNTVTIPQKLEDFYGGEDDYEVCKDDIERQSTSRDGNDSLFVQKVREFGSFDEATKFIAKKAVHKIFEVTIKYMKNHSMENYYDFTSTTPNTGECDDYDDILMCVYQEIDMNALWFFNCLVSGESPVGETFSQTVLKPYFLSFEKLFKKMNETIV